MGQWAFNKTIEEFNNGARKIKLLDGHQRGAADTVGIVTKLWVADGNLMFEASISKSASGEDIYIKLKEGILDQVSIGFMSSDAELLESGILQFNEIELMEISIVPIPANQKANILEVKKRDLTKEEGASKTELEETLKQTQKDLQESLDELHKAQVEYIDLQLRLLKTEMNQENNNE